MAESSQKDRKTLWEKEKLLVASNFSFSHSVFKRPVLQTRKNQGLFGKGLNKSLPISITGKSVLTVCSTSLPSDFTNQLGKSDVDDGSSITEV